MGVIQRVREGGGTRARQLTTYRLRLRQLITGAGAAGLVACNDVTEPAQIAQTIHLSASSVSLAPGTSQQISVTVSPQSGAVRLVVAGVPAGLSASLLPELLPQGETQSTLTVSAPAATPPGEGSVSVEASRGGGGDAVRPVYATAKLRVVVTGCPGYAIPTSCPPFPTGGSNAVSGVVVERTTAGTRPVAGAPVWAWVQYPNGNGYSAGRIVTDANGQYRFANLPNALILMQTWGEGYDMPCASVVQLTGPAGVANLELVSQAAPIAATDPAPPALVGVVYETTSTGRKPLAGVGVWFESFFDVVAAKTTTDELGRYSLCRLPVSASFVTPVRAGYVTTGRSVTVSGVMQMDLEMRRQ